VAAKQARGERSVTPDAFARDSAMRRVRPEGNLAERSPRACLAATHHASEAPPDWSGELVIANSVSVREGKSAPHRSPTD